MMAWIDVINQWVLDSDIPPEAWRWAHTIIGAGIVFGTAANLAYSPRLRYEGVSQWRDWIGVLIGKLGSTLYLFSGAIMLQAGVAANADEQPRSFFIIIGLGVLCMQLRSVQHARRQAVI